eukprot:TRINITY_DN7441_c0_g1_i3.p1 TRINITY_DN7441_c0_g1~~TRINITY_DN7441_c0_g1_i3.p1  ORF type:complete len:270 (+),score=33.75 TRINITY_DN7441_c0_g1_i3:92-901(+)
MQLERNPIDHRRASAEKTNLASPIVRPVGTNAPQRIIDAGWAGSPERRATAPRLHDLKQTSISPSDFKGLKIVKGFVFHKNRNLLASTAVPDSIGNEDSDYAYKYSRAINQDQWNRYLRNDGLGKKAYWTDQLNKCLLLAKLEPPGKGSPHSTGLWKNRSTGDFRAGLSQDKLSQVHTTRDHRGLRDIDISESRRTHKEEAHFRLKNYAIVFDQSPKHVSPRNVNLGVRGFSRQISRGLPNTSRKNGSRKTIQKKEELPVIIGREAPVL